MPAVSVNWSGWKDVGMAVANGVDPDGGPLAFLTPEDGWHTLLAAIASKVPQLLVGTVTGPLTANTLDLSAYQRETKPASATVAQQIRILGKGGQPLTETEQRVAEVWAETLGIQEVQLHEPFFDAGGSSLLISYLFKKLDEVYPGVIDITGLFVHETVADIAAYIDSRLAPEEEAPLEQIEQDVETLVGQFVSGALSEDELEALLENLT
jgi:polyketide synthase PksN